WVNRLTYSYGQVFGTVRDDCDGYAPTTTDRTPIAGVNVALMQASTIVATTTTNALGQYSFGTLDPGTYDVVVTPPAGGSSVEAIAGTGATSQTPLGPDATRIVLTETQSSSADDFAVSSVKAVPATASIAPDTRPTGDPGFTLTVNGSNFAPC